MKALKAVTLNFEPIEQSIIEGLSVNRVRLRHRLKLGDKTAIKLNRLLSRPARVLVTVLVITNLMNISAIICCNRLISVNEMPCSASV